MSEQPQDLIEKDPFTAVFRTVYDFEVALTKKLGIAFAKTEIFYGRNFDVVVALGSDRSFYLIKSADSNNTFIRVVPTWNEAKALAEAILSQEE